MTRVIIILSICAFSFASATAQKDSSAIETRIIVEQFYLPDSTYIDSIYLDITNGYGFTLGMLYSKYSTSFEIGFGKMSKGLVGSHLTNTGIYAGTELLFTNASEGVVWGPKISVWGDGGSAASALGLNTILYTNGKQSFFVFRPEVGIGLKGFEILYGHNFNFGDKCPWIGKHNLIIRFSFEAFGKERKTRTYKESFRQSQEKRDRMAQ